MRALDQPRGSRRHRRLGTTAWVVAAVLATATASAALPVSPHCDPSPEVQAILDQVAALRASCTGEEGCQEQVGNRLAGALEVHPDDFFLHREHQNHQRRVSGGATEELLERYRRLASELPADAGRFYLAGRIETEREVAKSWYQQGIEVDPDHPWSHLGLAWFGRTTRDRELAAKHSRRFVELCPLRSEGDRSLEQIDDDAFLAFHIDRLRGHLATLPLEETFSRLSRLWVLEFRVTPPVEHAGLRARITEELAAIAALEREDDDAGWLEALESGYAVVGDVEGQAWVEERRIATDPCSTRGQGLTEGRWFREHPRPSGGRSEEQRAWARALYQASGQWLEACPEGVLFWSSRFHAVEALDEIPDVEAQEVAERFLAVYGAQTDVRIVPHPADSVAKLYVERRMAPERALELLALAQEAADAEREELTDPSLDDEEREKRLWWAAGEDLYREVHRVRALAQAGELEGARATLTRVVSFLETMEPPPGEEAHGELVRTMGGAYVAALEGELAAAEGRALDWLASWLEQYRRASPERRSELAGQGAETWATLGGDPERWPHLVEALEGNAGEDEVREAELFVAWEARDRELPPMELTDLDGTVWRGEELRGKVVFANLWATWCGPCHAELPYVQALQEKLAGRDDVVLLTLNIDQNVGVVAPYLERRGFTFPVLFAERYVSPLLEPLSIPRNWILDAAGRLRYEQVGFNREVDQRAWIRQIVGLLDELADAP